jgi:hypothetical protein
VILTTEDLILPITHFKKVRIPLGEIAGVGVTPGRGTRALTVWTTDRKVYRSAAVCSIDGPEGSYRYKIVPAIWSEVQAAQGQLGPLMTTQPSFPSPMSTSFPGTRYKVEARFGAEASDVGIAEYVLPAREEESWQVGGPVEVVIDVQARRLGVCFPPGTFDLAPNRAVQYFRSSKDFRSVKLLVAQGHGT